MVLPQQLSYRGTASGALDTENSTHRDFSPTDCQVLVRDGQLLTGMLDKKALGDGGGGVIHILFNESGWRKCSDFIGECQFVVNYWLTQHGFSVGIGDTVADPETMTKIGSLIQDAKQSVQEIIKQYQGGALEEKPGRCVPPLLFFPAARATVFDVREGVVPAVPADSRAEGSHVRLVCSVGLADCLWYSTVALGYPCCRGTVHGLHREPCAEQLGRTTRTDMYRAVFKTAVQSDWACAGRSTRRSRTR